MSRDYATLRVFPETLPRDYPAKRLALIHDLASEQIDSETGEVFPPLISAEDARALLDSPWWPRDSKDGW